jgi:biotin carboxylase
VPGRSVLFVNLRRIPREGYETLIAAHRLGYQVVLVAHRLPDFARALVGDFREVDTADFDQALEAAMDLVRAHDVVGVPNFTEADVPLVTAIADRAGLPGLTPAAAVLARDKCAMKDALVGLGVLPGFARVHDLAELRAAVSRIGMPAVVKPAGGVGSKGIFELRDEKSLEPAMRHLARIARPEFDPVFLQFEGQLIVEEYVAGDELSVEGLVAGGQVHVIAVTDKLTTTPFHLELQHITPSGLPADVAAQVVEHAERIVTRLGFDNCSFHLEAIWGPCGFRFIEIAARPAGDYIACHLVPMATGIDFFENAIRVAVGAPLRIRSDRALHAGIRFILAESAGRFDGLSGVSQVLQTPGYEHVSLEVPIGTQVMLPPEHFGLQRVAGIRARHPDRQVVADLLAVAAAGMRARVTQGVGHRAS